MATNNPLAAGVAIDPERVLRSMPSFIRNRYFDMDPAQLEADREFQDWQNMSEPERFVQAQLMTQVRNATRPARQAALHGLSANQFSGFGGANDGSSAAYYRAVPRTQANPNFVQAALAGGMGSGGAFDQANAALDIANRAKANAQQQQMMSDPQFQMLRLIAGGIEPQAAADAIDQSRRLGASLSAGDYQSPMSAALVGGSEAAKRAAATEQIQQFAQAPTIKELLGGAQPEEFGLTQVQNAYDQWQQGKLNDADMSAMARFLAARNQAASPQAWRFANPLSLLGKVMAGSEGAAQRDAMQAWTDAIVAGTVARPELENVYLHMYRDSLQNRRNQSVMSGFVRGPGT